MKLGIALSQSQPPPRDTALTRPPEIQPTEDVLKVFYLQAVDANQCVEVIKQVFATDVPSIAALDAETLVVRGGSDSLKEIESLLQALDRSRPKEKDLEPPPSKLPPNDMLKLLDSVAATPTEAVTEQISLHRQLVADAEAKSIRLARHFREQGITEPGKTQTLVDEVRTAFNLRQKLSKLEIANLLQRTPIDESKC